MKYIIIGLSFMFPFYFYAQSNKNNFSGFIYDDESGEPLIGASIYCESKKVGAVSNNYGFFSLNIPVNDSTHIDVSHLGYTTNRDKWNKTKSPTIIYLKKNKYELKEIVVTANREGNQKAGVSTLTMNNIKNMPSLTGEVDLLKAFQLTAGIHGGAEGSVGLMVRGGSNDQNLYLLDGVPLYYVNHIGGVSSVFDISTIKSATIYKGFFPASYGGRLSSVMDVVLKDGNINKTKKEISIGTLASKFFIEGGLGKKKKITYIASARICNIGLFTMLGDNGCYLYYDINSKLTYRVNENNKLYFSLYAGDDFYIKKDKENIESGSSEYRNKTVFGNSMASMKWLHVFDSDISSNLMLTYSNFHNNNRTNSRYKIKDLDVSSEQLLKTSMQDLQLKGDIELHRFTNHQFKIGFASSFQVFQPHVSTYKEKDGNLVQDSTLRSKVNATQNDLYIEDTWTINKLINIYGGLRFSSFIPFGQKNYCNIEPRFSLNLLPLKNTSINIGYSRMSQYIHLLSNNDGGIPKDIWLPSTNKVQPGHSNQYEVEFNYKFPSGYSASIGGYYKTMSHLIDYGGYIQQNAYWEDNIEVDGKGICKGAEFALSKEVGKVTGFVSYVWSKSTRKFSGINKGKEFPFKYDHPHQFNLFLNYKISEILSVSATWTYHTGNAITMSFEKYQLESGNINIENGFGDIHIYSGRNSYRMPAYHRLDIGVTLNQKRGEWHLAIYNAYNKMNPYYYYFQKSGDSYKMKQTTLFPFLPSIAYVFRF